jgi:hypothetical protein
MRFYSIDGHSVYASGGFVPTLRCQQKNPLMNSLQVFCHHVRVPPRHLRIRMPENPTVRKVEPSRVSCIGQT